VESLTFPGITSTDGYYTQEQIRSMQDFAMVHGVTIIPEIDSPGHASCFTRVFPELKRPGLPDNYVDVTNPETFRIMQLVFDEIIELFDSEDIHIGTDEYRMGGCSDEEKEFLGEAFRKYINHFARYLKTKGRRARIWSGYEYMKGTTEPDTDIVIDMWETTDAKSKIDVGYDVINSSHFYTYIVPGAPYYGVDDRFIYEEWTPRVFKKSSKDKVLDIDQNEAQADPGVLDDDHPQLLGGKLHVWNDFGPEGYTTTEITQLILESMPGFSEKLWGTQTTERFEDFKPMAESLTTVPRTTIMERIPGGPDGLVYDSGDAVFEFQAESSFQPLPWEGSRAELEYPWTVEMEIHPTAAPDSPQVFLGSRICEFTLNLVHERKEGRGEDEKVIVTKGIGLERADHYREEPLRGEPTGHRTLHAFDSTLPLNEWSKVTITGDRKKCTLAVNDTLIGEAKVQMVCPLEYLGGKRGHSLIGKIRNVRIHDRILG
jgi:hexosaminidase